MADRLLSDVRAAFLVATAAAEFVDAIDGNDRGDVDHSRFTEYLFVDEAAAYLRLRHAIATARIDPSHQQSPSPPGDSEAPAQPVADVHAHHSEGGMGA